MAINLTNLTANVNNIQALSDKPNETDGLTAQGLKEKFDKAGADIKSYINGTLINELERNLNAHETKFTEIDNTFVEVNGNIDAAKSELAGSIDNVRSELNNMKAITLWENTAQSTSIGETTITLSSSDWDAIEIYYNVYPSNSETNRIKCEKVMKGKQTQLGCFFHYNGKVYMGHRMIDYIDGSTLKFRACVTLIDGNSFVIGYNNGWCVPEKILGYKFS